MSADQLRRAAKVLREHAEGATPGPWQHVDYADPEGQPNTADGRPSTFMGCGSVITMGENVWGGDVAAPNGDLYPRSGYSPSDDMALIALMGPPVALALAEWLGYECRSADHHYPIWSASTEVPDADAHVEAMYARPLAVARAILREDSDG